MRAYVFTDAALARHAGRFVWLEMDTEKKQNATFRTQFPVTALPTFLIVDPMTEKVALRWVGGATVVSAYSPRVRPGVPVSFPLAWDELDDVTPSDFTVHTALDALGDRDPWAEHMPAPQHLSDELVAEGHEIPVARVQAMHEGKRRKRARGG